MGPQAVYSWNNYYSKWPSYYRNPYNLSDYAMGKEMMRDLLFNVKRINATNISIWNTEFGWTPTDNLQACQDFFDLMDEARNNWYCWWWWGNPNNYGLCTDETFTSLTPHGEIMQQHLVGLKLA